MDKIRFAELVREPVAFKAGDCDALQRMAEAYPFSAPVGLLAMLAAKAESNEPNDGKAVSLMLPHTGRLGELMAAVKPLPAKEDEFDVLKAINSYKEVSFKTAPKSVILSNFLAADDFDTPSEQQAEALSIAELGKNSISDEGVLESETLALVLEKQGRYEKAAEVYRKLILKYPEKSSTFAARIAELEILITNKQ
ncbi:MAG: hypothetical protein K5650_05965 [Bacteroidales bacterium]|nr:hypothetical protein [Bacteroidales bacterium]